MLHMPYLELFMQLLLQLHLPQQRLLQLVGAAGPGYVNTMLLVLLRLLLLLWWQLSLATTLHGGL